MQLKQQIIATLLKAGKPDLANEAATLVPSRGRILRVVKAKENPEYEKIYSNLTTELAKSPPHDKYNLQKIADLIFELLHQVKTPGMKDQVVDDLQFLLKSVRQDARNIQQYFYKDKSRPPKAREPTTDDDIMDARAVREMLELAYKKAKSYKPKVSAAGPVGKAQKAIMDYVAKAGGPVELTDMSAHPSLRGVHFGQIQKAAEVLHKRGLIKFDGKTLSKAKVVTASDWKPDEKKGQWNLSVYKSRATRWDFFLKNPQGGGGGSSSYTSMRAAIRAATARVDFGDFDRIWVMIKKWNPDKGDYDTVKSYWEKVSNLQVANVVASNPDILIKDVSVREGPQDDLDPDFVCEVDATFEVKGRTLASIMGKQERVLEKEIKKLNERQAFNLLELGRKSDPIHHALNRPIDKAVNWATQDDFDRSSKVLTWEFSNDRSFWKAQMFKDSIVYDVEISVHGKWWQ